MLSLLCSIKSNLFINISTLSFPFSVAPCARSLSFYLLIFGSCCHLLPLRRGLRQKELPWNAHDQSHEPYNTIHMRICRFWNGKHIHKYTNDIYNCKKPILCMCINTFCIQYGLAHAVVEEHIYSIQLCVGIRLNAAWIVDSTDYSKFHYQLHTHSHSHIENKAASN